MSTPQTVIPAMQARTLSSLPARRTALALQNLTAAAQPSTFQAALARANAAPSSLTAPVPWLGQNVSLSRAPRAPTSLIGGPRLPSIPGAALALPTGTGGDISSLPFSSLILSAARSAGIDPALIAAVAKAESGFNPRAQSPVGAKGLMQLMDATARGLGVTDSFDPAQNLNGGARFLAGLLKRFNGDPRLALAAYNAGPGAVDKYGGIPPYEETQRYVPRVLGYYAQLASTRPATA